MHNYLGLKLLRQDFYITADSNRFQKSAYVSMQVQRCPRLLHLLLILIHWGRRRRIIGNSRNSFLSDENLATIFLVFCEESDFINKVSLMYSCISDFRKKKWKLLVAEHKGAFLWEDTDLDLWSKITQITVHQRNGALVHWISYHDSRREIVERVSGIAR